VAGALKNSTIMRRRSNNLVVNLHGTWSDERTIANTYWSQPRTDNTVSWLAIRVMPASDRLGDTMTKPKMWEDPAHSLDADWPPHQSPIMDLVACARAVDWDFTTWCHASGHDATDAHAHLMFECLLAYASRPEGRAGLN
jgi:hypothetical protein